MKMRLSICLVVILVSQLVIVGSYETFSTQASESISGIINPDTIWTKTNSPYDLTGNVLVEQGVRLAIEAGVTVNLHDYYIMVNGTLQAKGTSSDKIIFLGSGYISFSATSSAWNEQTGSGCIIENANFDSGSIVADGAPKISGCSMQRLPVAGSAIIMNNIISGDIRFSSLSVAPVVSHNTIGGNVNIPYHAAYPSGIITVSNNKISGGVSLDYELGNIKITNNEISGGITSRYEWPGQHYSQIEISQNNISGTVLFSGETIFSYNTVTGTVSAVGSNNIIYNNTVTPPNPAPENSIGICLPEAYIETYFNESIVGNRVVGFTTGISVGTSDTNYGEYGIKALIDSNYVANCNYAIRIFEPSIISNNVVTGNHFGIDGGNIIERNVVVNNYYGVHGGRSKYNTIANNAYGILSGATSGYNNIFNNSIYNLDLGSTNLGYVPSDVNATYNWWGTTDQSAISQTFYDYYKDFNLGKVIFVPFLNAPDPQTPTSTEKPTPPPLSSLIPLTSTSPSPTATPTSTAPPSTTSTSSDYNIQSNSTITDIVFDREKQELRFSVTGPSGTIGYVNLTIAKSFLASIDDLKIYLGQSQIEPQIFSNETSWIITFTYLHSTHQVTIKFAAASIDFTLWGVILATIIISVAGIVLLAIYKKRINKKKGVTLTPS